MPTVQRQASPSTMSSFKAELAQLIRSFQV
jgi:hypothetical protein